MSPGAVPGGEILTMETFDIGLPPQVIYSYCGRESSPMAKQGWLNSSQVLGEQ
jgi:hypothetical protein